MKGKRLLLVLISSLSGGLLLWYAFVYQPQQVEHDKLKLQLSQIQDKLRNAQHANLDLENVEKQLIEERENLQRVSMRFVGKNELSRISEEIKKLAEEHNLTLTDFAPIMENYFSNTADAKVKALPLSITVRGGYLNIGRFIENWEQLSFYLTPEEIAIQRIKPESNELSATIMTKLYARGQ